MKLINLEQGSEAWHKFRKSHIGASEISMIMGSNPWKTAYELWLEKTDRVKPKKANKAMQRGSDMEETALHEFISQSKRFYEPKVGVYSKLEVASASFDGISEDHKHIAEVKVPMEKSYNDMLENGVPLYYYHQTQWQIMVTEKAIQNDLFVFASEDLNFSHSVFPNKELHDEMLVKARDFWECVENDVPPELTEKDHLLITDDYQLSVLASNYLESDELNKASESAKKANREALTAYVGGKNIKGYGIKVTSNKGRKTLNLEKLKLDYGISEESLQKYYTTGKSFVTVSKSGNS